MKIRSFKVLFKFIFSFFVIMIVPFSFFSYILYHQVRLTETEKIIADASYRLNGVAFSIEDALSQMQSLKSSMNNEVFLHDFFIQNNGGAHVYIYKYLQRLAAENSLFLDLDFYNVTTETYYNATYVARGDTYFETNGISKEGQDNFEKAFKSSGATSFSLEKNIGEEKQLYFTHIIPFESNVSSKTSPFLSYIILKLSPKQMHTFSSTFVKDDIYKIVLKSDEHFLYTNDISIVTDSNWITHITKEEHYFQTIQNIQYLQIESNNTDSIQAIGLVPASLIDDEIESVLKLYFSILTVALILGSGLIVVFVYYNYTPILKLEKELQSIPLQSDATGNFFGHLAKSIQQNQMEKDSINSQSLFEKRQIALIKLCSIGFYKNDIDAIKETCLLIGLNLYFDAFTVYIIELSEPITNSNQISQMFNAPTHDKYHLYAEYSINSLRILVLACHNGNEHLKNITKEIKEKTAILSPLCIGVSTTKDQLHNVHKAYSEAMYAIGEKDLLATAATFRQNTCPVFYFNKESDILSRVLLIHKECDIMQEELFAKNPEKALLSYHAIELTIQRTQNDNLSDMTCFNVLNRCLSVASSLKLSETEHLWATLEHSILADVTSAELIRMTAAIVENICEQIPMHSTSDDKERKLDIKQIKDYIERNYQDINFSLKGLVSDFDTSLSNMSHYFKSKTGITLSEYVNQLKIETVKKMLISTDYPISTIAEHVGYQHTSNFIKKFKVIEGMTPNEYRKKFGTFKST